MRGWEAARVACAHLLWFSVNDRRPIVLIATRYLHFYVVVSVADFAVFNIAFIAHTF